MKIGLFTEFSYPGKSERQAYAEVLAQISLADELGYDFFSTTESFGKDEVSCSPFPLGLYIAAAQRARRFSAFRSAVRELRVAQASMSGRSRPRSTSRTGGMSGPSP